MTSNENIEVAKFLHHHAKNIKLTKNEYDYLDNLLFLRNSSTKKSMSLFSRATPLPFGSTPSTNFKQNQSYFSVSSLKTSKKRLEIHDYHSISKKDLIEFEEVKESIEFNANLANKLDKSSDDLAGNNYAINDSDTRTISPPRQMTDAAKELMASISINFDLPDEYLIETKKDAIILPNYESRIVEINFDKKEENVCQNSLNIFGPRSESIDFSFDITEFDESDPNYMPEKNLPSFFFQID